MPNYSETSGQQLDTEFDQNLACMKKYILELKDRKSKQLCALWIKKLCETSSDNNDSFQSKCIRNQYSLQLLSLLESYEPLKFPFSERPPSENLKSYEEVIERRNFERPNKTSKEESAKNNENDAMYANNSFDVIFSDQMFDYQMKLLENRFKEEKINLQQYHSDELQKILDRKNGEIETLKTNFNRKRKEYEENITSLEKKVQSLSKQIILDRETYEKELNELKHQYDKSLEKRQFEIEKKLNEMVNKYEKEKFDLQKGNTKAFQDLVDETNLRLKKVEAEYNQQQLINDKVIYELENRTQLLKAEMEKNISLTKSLEQENQEKQSLIESVQKRLNEEINKNSHLQNEINSCKENKSQEINQLTSKYETMLDSKMRELESHANELSDELERLKSDYEKRIDKLNQALKEKDQALQNANGTIKQQKLQAEHALNELKIDIERNSNKLYDEMKNQMTKVENDLDKSKSIREKQSKEFNKQIEHLKSEHKKEIEKLNNEFAKEKQRIHSSHEKLYSQIQGQFHQQLVDSNLCSKMRIDEMSQTISRLERELFESNELRKQQITELGLIRQDEKIKNEMEIERIRSSFEHELSAMKKRWKEEKEMSRDDCKVRDERMRRLNERISELEACVNSERGENKRLKEALEREKDDCYSAIEAEKTALKRNYAAQLMDFEKELDLEKAKCRSIEKKIKQMSYDNEQNILDLKMHYEERLKGLLPLSIKNDYEETISALRSQVDSLQQRTLILQSDFDERNQMINSSKSSI